MNTKNTFTRVCSLEYKLDHIDYYKYYMQATEGDCNIFSIKDIRKWYAWYSIRGMSSEDAMIEYINLYIRNI